MALNYCLQYNHYVLLVTSSLPLPLKDPLHQQLTAGMVFQKASQRTAYNTTCSSYTQSTDSDSVMTPVKLSLRSNS